jgi:AcrR family transcriptional regulator
MAPTRKNPKRAYRSAQRDAARDATRARIVSAAGRVLRERGWGSFSVEAVARAAGVTRLTVYHQFGERRALLEAVFDEEAARGGLSGIARAMQSNDPHASLAAVAKVFCAFWAKSGPMQGVVAAAMADPELAEAIGARNERRRQLLDVVVERMVKRKDVRRARVPELVDTLFALTSFAFYAELRASRLTPERVCAAVQELAGAAVEGARGKPRRRRESST